MTDQLLTPSDVAQRCQVSTKTVLRAIQAGRLRASRLGRRGAYRVRVADIEAWLDDTSVPVSNPRAGSAPTSGPVYVSPASAGRLVVGERMGRRQ